MIVHSEKVAVTWIVFEMLYHIPILNTALADHGHTENLATICKQPYANTFGEGEDNIRQCK